MSEARRKERLIAEVTADVLSAWTLDGALEAITLDLREHYPLWRSSVWSFDPPEGIRLDAFWSVGDTFFEVGTVIHIELTDDLEFLVGSLADGKPVLVRTGERDLGLLTDVLKREGVECSIAAPIGRVRKEPVGFLVLSSSKRDAFKSKDVRLVSAISRAVGMKLTSLLEAATEQR